MQVPDPIILPFFKYLVKIRLKSLEILDTPLVMKFMVQCKGKYGQAPPIIFPMAAPDLPPNEKYAKESETGCDDFKREKYVN